MMDNVKGWQMLTEHSNLTSTPRVSKVRRATLPCPLISENLSYRYDITWQCLTSASHSSYSMINYIKLPPPTPLERVFLEQISRAKNFICWLWSLYFNMRHVTSCININHTLSTTSSLTKVSQLKTTNTSSFYAKVCNFNLKPRLKCWARIK